MKKLFLVLILCISNLVFASDAPNFPFLSVKSEADVELKPDTAKITFVIKEFNKEAKEATKVVVQRAQAILHLAKVLNVNEDQVISSEYGKSIIRKQGESYNKTDIAGYEITQTFTVTIDQISKYSNMVDQLVAMQNVDDIRSEFDISNRADVESQLIKQASQNARKKAENLAAGMNVKLGDVFALSTDNDFSPYSAIFGAPNYDQFVVNSAPDFVPPPSLDFIPDSSIMFVPKSIKFRKSVNVIFKIKS